MSSSSSNQDLRTYLRSLAAQFPDDIITIKERVTHGEVGAVVRELELHGRDEVLIFSNVEGIDGDLVTNLFASRERIARLLKTHGSSLHSAFYAAAARTRAPRILKEGALFSVVQDGDNVDLSALPMIQHYDTDRGAYITSGILIAEDPDTRVGNMSYHRATPHSRNELATSLHSRGDLWRMLTRAAVRGMDLPIAMVIGGHPLLMLAAAAKAPADVDERAVAGGLFGKGLEVAATPVHGILVPASAELVLEGSLLSDRNVDEGPFGEFTGYSSDRSTRNVIRVDRVLRRPNAILVDVCGGNSADHLNLSRIPREADMVSRLRQRFPEVVAVHYPTSGTHFHCYVAVDQRLPGGARQVIAALLGWDPYLKLVVAVDSDVDVTNDRDVLWALATRFQPHRDVVIIDGLPGSLLDPSSTSDGRTSRMGLDATKGEDFRGMRLSISEEPLVRARQLLGYV